MASKRFDFLGWQEDLLAYERGNTRFDLGEIELPFRRELVPLRVWQAWLTVLMPLPGIALAIWLVEVALAPGHALGQTLIGLGLAGACAVASVPFLLTAFAGRRRQAEVRIDREAVEVVDRPPLRKPIHWREPLSHYTGVRCHVVEITTRGGDFSMELAAHAIDLDHPDEDRIVPLYRSDRDEGVEERWTRFAAALGLPKTGGFRPGIVTGRMFGIPQRRSDRRSDRKGRRPEAKPGIDAMAGPLRAGALFGAAGLACALAILHGARGEGWGALVPAAGIAAALTGAAAWKLFVAERGGRARGGLVGAGVGLLAHPLAWYLALLQACFGGVVSSLGDPLPDPFHALGASLVLSLGSLIVSGWLTVPVGMAVGLLLAGRRAPGGSRRRRRSSAVY